MILRSFKAPPQIFYCPFCCRYYHASAMKQHEHSGHEYTHVDPQGLRWRFDGARPVSELADAVMADVTRVVRRKRPIKPRAKRRGHA